jgi:hypothetical protein
MLALVPALYLLTLTTFSMFTAWYWLTKIIYPAPVVVPYYAGSSIKGRIGPVVFSFRATQYLYT